MNRQSSEKRPKRLVDVLQAATTYLQERGIEHPRWAVEHVMSAALGCPRLDLYLRFNAELTPDRLDRLRKDVRRLAAHEPLQYVLGEWAFRGQRLRTDRRALIPRPETEGLVEWVLSDELSKKDGPLAVLDVGTGSGCIAIALALERAEISCWAVDISDEALALALENAEQLGVDGRIFFRKADLFPVAPLRFDVIVANLPYVPSREMDRLPETVRRFEPLLALDGGEDGLNVIGRLAAEAPAHMAFRGRLYLEIGCDQGAAVHALLERGGWQSVETRRDLTGRERYVRAICGDGGGLPD